MPLVFLDTNVLLYAIDDSAPAKQAQALALIAQLERDQSGVVSTQVLLEYNSNLTRKFKASRHSAARLTSAFAKWHVVSNDAALVLRALARSVESDLSIWDATVVEAAVLSGADTLYSEGLSHGQRFGALTVVNPFI
jgi:predicted nucleic acid-binding protein